MDPRIAWYPPEQCGKASLLWTKIWETQLGQENMDPASNSNTNRNPFTENRGSDFIPLDISNDFDHKQGINNHQRNNQHSILRERERHKKENRASTYGLNHSSVIHKLENGGLTPWVPPGKTYSPDVIG